MKFNQPVRVRAITSLIACVAILGGTALSQARVMEAQAPAPKQEKPQAAGEARQKQARVDQPVADFTLRDITDERSPARSILQHKGDKCTVLFFMMEKCSHTGRYAPRVAALAQKLKQDVEFIGVRCNVDDSLPALVKLARKNKLSIPILDDADGSLSRYFRVRVSPTFVVIDREGVLRFFGGYDTDPGHKLPTPAEPVLEPVLQAIVRGDEVRVKRTVPNGCAIRPPGQ